MIRLSTIMLLIMLSCSCALKESETENGDDAGDDTQTGTNIASGVDAADADLPRRMAFSQDGHRLVNGSGDRKEYYRSDYIGRIDLTFPQSDWWSLLTANYQSETEIAAAMSYDGAPLAYKVGVRFKGFTSYNQNRTEKKSFNISVDYENSEQDVNGYQNLNLNCAFGDDSFMREVVYETVSQHYIPALANNYVELYINGQYWGIYVNSQQVDGDLLKEWFLSNDGTRWRAEPSSGMGGGGFGGGYSGLNYLGDSTSNYEPYYTLKKANKDNPWTDLVTTCSKLNNTSTSSYTDVATVLDIDKALWFLACENIFTDEDSYISKGGTDYYIYWEVETGRISPLEYDGNSCLESRYASWSPFYNATSSKYPLLYKLLNIPEYRQRYLAHYRTILAERFNPDFMNDLIDETAARIDDYIQADPKKMMSYSEFTTAVSTLKSIVSSRYNYLVSNSEVQASGLTISDSCWLVNGVQWAQPDASQAILVTTRIGEPSAVASVILHAATGIVGNFSSHSMYDDGAHGDGAADDGVFGCTIPAQSSGYRVRFYIEAIASDSAKTKTFDPAGAEHDFYTVRVK